MKWEVNGRNSGSENCAEHCILIFLPHDRKNGASEHLRENMHFVQPTTALKKLVMLEQRKLSTLELDNSRWSWVLLGWVCLMQGW